LNLKIHAGIREGRHEWAHLGAMVDAGYLCRNNTVRTLWEKADADERNALLMGVMVGGRTKWFDWVLNQTGRLAPDLAHTSRSGVGLLGVCVAFGRPDMARRLMAQGAPLDNRESCRRLSPVLQAMQHASASGMEDLFFDLMAQHAPGFSGQRQNRMGLAVQGQSVRIVRFCLERGDDPNGYVNRPPVGHSPDTHFATSTLIEFATLEARQREMAQILGEAGARLETVEGEPLEDHWADHRLSMPAWVRELFPALRERQNLEKTLPQPDVASEGLPTPLRARL
jgi:hypothetical protein